MPAFNIMRLIALLPCLFLLNNCSLFDFNAEESAYYASVKKAGMVPLLPEELYPDSPEKAINHLPEANGTPLYAGRVMSETERAPCSLPCSMPPMFALSEKELLTRATRGKRK